LRINHLSLLLNKRRTRNRKQKQNFPYFLSRTGFILITLISLLFMVFISLAGFTYADLTTDLPSLENLTLMLNPDEGLLQQPTRIYDRSGQTVLLTLENPGIPREYYSINPDAPRHFSPQLVQIVVALNEPDFWRSPGFSWNNLLDPQPRTIAEYLVNDLLLETEPAGYRRSLRMRLLAAQVVSEYGRIQVLEWYLNSVYFGHLAYGADSAAQLYLGKPASDLNLAEVVLLVSLIETPALNPLDAPAAAVERQQQVLDELETLNILNAAQIQEARQTDLLMLTDDTRAAQLEQNEFTEAVLEQLEENFSLHQLERGGLKVISTLDLQLEFQLECTLNAQLEILAGGSDQTMPAGCEAASLLPTLFEPSLQLKDLSGRALLLEPSSGQVLAMSGALTLSGSQNKVQEIIPGSILTPFVAMAAFSSGMSPSTQVWDLPLEGSLSADDTFLESFQGPLRLRTALANDYVTPFTNLLGQMIPENVWRLAEPLGLSGLSQFEDPGSLLQEGGSVSLQEVAQAYSVFANQGYLYG
jgi:penicillin-binding protein 1A